MKEESNKHLTSTMENYLEAIYNLNKEKRVVRVKDIARAMGVKMPSVTNMLKALNEKGLVNYERYEFLELTDEGAGVGEEINKRHHVLRDFLTDILGVDFDEADEEACRMEHAISETTMERLVSFVDFIQSCPRTSDNWLERFQEFREHGRQPAKCLKHMEVFADQIGDKLKEMQTEEKDPCAGGCASQCLDENSIFVQDIRNTDLPG